MLNIESAEYTLLEGQPALCMTINGHNAYVCDVRRPLLQAGFVYLISLEPGFYWENELPVLVIPPTPGLCTSPLPFPGMTDDPQVLRLTQAFVDILDGKGHGFRPGPIAF